MKTSKTAKLSAIALNSLNWAIATCLDLLLESSGIIDMNIQVLDTVTIY